MLTTTSDYVLVLTRRVNTLVITLRPDVHSSDLSARHQILAATDRITALNRIARAFIDFHMKNTSNKMLYYDVLEYIQDTPTVHDVSLAYNSLRPNKTIVLLQLLFLGRRNPRHDR